jgi:hypothetical protein
MGGLCRSVAALDIVKDGKAVATVVLPEKTDETAKEAAQQIVENLRLCTGVTLPVAPEAQAPAEGTLIAIGKTAASETLNLDVDKQLADTCFLRVQGRTLFLVGRDADVKGDVKGSNSAQGTLSAAFALLRDYAGVRWIIPGPQGVWTPKAASISVPDDLNRKIEPTILYIHPRLDAYYPWSRANGARTAIRILGGGEKWGEAVPAAKYADSHPEYFAMRDGKRLADAKNNDPSLCTSNPEVVNLLTRWVQSKFDEGYDVVDLGECDAYRGRSCQCEQCTKLFGEAWTEKNNAIKGTALRVYLPHMEVVKRCLKSHPNKFVMLMVYSLQGSYLTDIASGRVPNPGIEFPPNTIANLCHSCQRRMIQTKRIIPQVSNYVYWWCQFHGGMSPKQTPASALTFMRMLIDKKSMGIYFDGGAENWPGEAPTLYVALRSMQDPVPEPDDFMKEFCTGLFGKAADTMSQYYRLLHIRIRDTIDGNVCYCMQVLFGDVPDDHVLGEKYLTFWPEANLKKMDELLKKASEEAADDERTLNWIRFTRIGYDQIAVTRAVYQAERNYEANKNATTLAAIKTRMDAFNQFVQRMADLPKTDKRFVDDYFPNYGQFMNLLTKDEECGVGRGVPFRWDTGKLLDEGKLP